MKIAIIGTGISGMVAAHLLHPEHELTIFEREPRIGGHTHTVDVTCGEKTYAVDTGFIVFNDRTYPNFIKLLAAIGVESQPSEMSFSVRCEASGLEYNGSSLNQLFAQRRNLIRPSFYRMLRDVLRFNREASALLDNAADDLSLGQYLDEHSYSRGFVEHYIVPMGASIWSADAEGMRRVPARFFVQFFSNHGLLTVNDRPQWRVIRGGSQAYATRLTEPFRDCLRLGTPVRGVLRHTDHVRILTDHDEAERFDHVIVATHSDQALNLLQDPSPQEQEVLGAIRYQENDTVLHTDSSLLPTRRQAWAGWNYHIVPQSRQRTTITYNMNILQGIQAPQTFCVTLNRTSEIDPDSILRRMTYHHPVYTADTLRAQRLHHSITGHNRTHYCGAYWGYGFHEDGVNSALQVCRAFGATLA